MAKDNPKPSIQGHELSDQAMAELRAEAEQFDTIEHIDDDARQLIDNRWPELLPQRTRPKRPH
jgi:hypothetical protein